MIPFSTRLATPADAETIACLAITVWISTYVTDSLRPAYARLVMEQFTVENVRRQIASSRSRIWLAETPEGLLGFAELVLDERTDALTESRQAEVARLYVLERFTRRGIGRVLLERCVSTALAEGLGRVWLSVYEGNQRALAYYQKLGWRQVGTLSFKIENIDCPNLIFANPDLP